MRSWLIAILALLLVACTADGEEVSPPTAPQSAATPATPAPLPTATASVASPAAEPTLAEMPTATILPPTATPTETVATAPPATATMVPATTTDLTEMPITAFASGLDQQVALAWAPDGRLFVAELVTGRVRAVSPSGEVQAEAVAEFQVAHPPGYSEHGLLGLALHPQFDSNHLIYVFFSVPDGIGRPVKQVIARFPEAEGRATGEPEIVVDNLPVGPNCCHNGGRIAFGPDGKLYATLGDTQDSALAQRSDDVAGSVLRYNDDGSVPDDGPFGAGNPVWAIGLRNPFGLAFDSDTGELFVTENGPTQNDETNRIERGQNYGWPVVTGVAGRDEFVDPIWVHQAPVAPTGLTVYRATVLPGADGDLFFCNWIDGQLRQLEHDGSDERQLFDDCRTDVVVGPDGALYIAGSETIWRLGPEGE